MHTVGTLCWDKGTNGPYGRRVLLAVLVTALVHMYLLPHSFFAHYSHEASSKTSRACREAGRKHQQLTLDTGVRNLEVAVRRVRSRSDVAARRKGRGILVVADATSGAHRSTPEMASGSPSMCHLRGTAQRALLALAVALLLAWSSAGELPVERSRRQRTFAMVKPDAAASARMIVDMAEQQGFTVVANKTLTLSRAEASLFYREHSGRPFFPGLVDFMTSGPVVALVLEREDAVSGWRELIGPTNSHKAKRTARKSIRAKFGTDGQRNAVHGSDSEESARREVDFFFGARALVPIHFRILFDQMRAVFAALQLQPLAKPS